MTEVDCEQSLFCSKIRRNTEGRTRNNICLSATPTLLAARGFSTRRSYVTHAVKLITDFRYVLHVRLHIMSRKYYYKPCILLYTHVYPCIPLYTLVYPCIPMYTHVHPCIPMYTHVYPCIPMYTRVRPCI